MPCVVARRPLSQPDFLRQRRFAYWLVLPTPPSTPCEPPNHLTTINHHRCVLARYGVRRVGACYYVEVVVASVLRCSSPIGMPLGTATSAEIGVRPPLSLQPTPLSPNLLRARRVDCCFLSELFCFR